MLTGWESRAEDYRHFKGKKNKKKKKKPWTNWYSLLSGLLHQCANKLTDGMSGVWVEIPAFLTMVGSNIQCTKIKSFWTLMSQDIVCASFTVYLVGSWHMLRLQKNQHFLCYPPNCISNFSKPLTMYIHFPTSYHFIFL